MKKYLILVVLFVFSLLFFCSSGTKVFAAGACTNNVSTGAGLTCTHTTQECLDTHGKECTDTNQCDTDGSGCSWQSISINDYDLDCNTFYGNFNTCSTAHCQDGETTVGSCYTPFSDCAVANSCIGSTVKSYSCENGVTIAHVNGTICDSNFNLTTTPCDTAPDFQPVPGSVPEGQGCNVSSSVADTATPVQLASTNTPVPVAAGHVTNTPVPVVRSTATNTPVPVAAGQITNTPVPLASTNSASGSTGSTSCPVEVNCTTQCDSTGYRTCQLLNASGGVCSNPAPVPCKQGYPTGILKQDGSGNWNTPVTATATPTSATGASTKTSTVSCTAGQTVCDTATDHSCNGDWCDAGSGKYDTADPSHTNKNCKKYGNPAACALCNGGQCKSAVVNGVNSGTCSSCAAPAASTGGGAGGVASASGAAAGTSGSCTQDAVCDVPACNDTQTDPATGKPGTPGKCSACSGLWCNAGKCVCNGKAPIKPEVTAAPGAPVPSVTLSADYPNYYTDGTSCTGCSNGNFSACPACGNNPCKCIGGIGGTCPHYCWKPGTGAPGGAGGGGAATATPGVGTPTVTPTPAGVSCDAARLHVVLVGDGYASDTDIATFNTEANAAKNGLLNTEPYKSASGDIDIKILDPNSSNIQSFYSDKTKKTFGCVLFDKNQFDPSCIDGNTETNTMQIVTDAVMKEYPTLPTAQANLKIVILANSGPGVDPVSGQQGTGVTNGIGGNFALIQTQKDANATPQPQYVQTFIHEVGGHAVGLLYDRYVLPGLQPVLQPGGPRSNCTDSAGGEAFWNDVRKSLSGAQSGTQTPTPVQSGSTPTASANAFPSCESYDYAPVTSDCGPAITAPNGQTINAGGSSDSVMGVTTCAKPDGTKPTGFDAYEQAWIKGLLHQYQCDSGGHPLDNLNGCHIDPLCTQGQGHVCEIVCSTPTPTSTGTITPTVSPTVTGTITPAVSPVPTVTLTQSQKFFGKQETADCTAITGWVCDKNSPTTILSMGVLEQVSGKWYTTGSPMAFSNANIIRDSTVSSQCGGTANHGYSISIPDSMKDGKTHQLMAIPAISGQSGVNYATDFTNYNASPQALTCPKP